MKMMSGRGGSPKFTTESVTLVQALDSCIRQLEFMRRTRVSNPISLLCHSLLGVELNLHSSSSIITENCRKIRQFVSKIIE